MKLYRPFKDFTDLELRALLPERDFWALDTMTSGANNPGALRLNSIAIREWGAPAREVILRKREEIRARNARWSWGWGTRVSRRAQRGNHHDSWAIRESYVRYSDSSGGSYVAFLSLGHELIKAAASAGARVGGQITIDGERVR